MANLVVATAMMKCSMGVAPGSLIVIRPKVMADKKPAANIMDYKPMVNVPTFGMCNAKPNPAVIAATAAALGTPTPAPCVPMTTAPWAPGKPKVLIEKQPALDDGSKLMCNWTGVIEITSAGQVKVQLK